MRTKMTRALARIRQATPSLTDVQGVAGVAAVTGGAFILWGIGVALLVFGGFLLVAAAVSR